MLKANQNCMIECAYDAVGCAYLIGQQVVLEACNFEKLNSLIFCMGAEYAEPQACLGYLGYLRI